MSLASHNERIYRPLSSSHGIDNRRTAVSFSLLITKEAMESLSEGILSLREITTHNERKRQSSPLYLSDISSLDSKRPRLDDDDESSKASRWSQYRDCSNLSTLTEASDTQPELPQEGTSVNSYVISAPQVPNLEKHIDNLLVQLEAWSLVCLKEWRQKQDVDTMMDVEDESTPSRTTRQRQKAAKRKLMRTLRRKQEEVTQENKKVK